MKNKIYLSPPDMGENERKYMLEAFDSNWISPAGPDIELFELEMCSYLQSRYACAVSSGTSALHLAIKILGIKKNDRVLCPSLTFSATANAIMYENAIPIFLDVDLSTWTIDINILEKSIKKYNPKALITVDLYGQSCQYEEILEICKKNNVKVIEDAAEALGSTYKTKKCGTLGEISILSFNGNKIMTTGGGGMLLSDNENLVKKAKYLSTQAREPVLHYEHKELGYNYRMSNILASIGRGQLEQIDSKVNKRREVFNYYEESLKSIDGLDFMPEANYGRSNRWLTCLTVDKQKTQNDRNSIIKALEIESIEARPVWKPMHLQPFFSSYNFSYSGKDNSEQLYTTGLCLPSGSSLKNEDQNRIIDIIHDKLKKR